MKITMTVTLDVDPGEWDDEYRCGSGRDEVRADVVQYVTTTLQTFFGVDGSGGVTTGVRSVSVRAKGVR